jgi:pyruvate,orthophosphate dikinase
MASGGIATTSEAAQAAATGGARAILVRAETSPDDVHGMAVAAGILTSRGGLASHAAVVARGWGIPAVVGATGLVVADDRVVIGDREFAPGVLITIDGRTGEVFEGVVAGTTDVVPEVRTLLGWATELGIEVAQPGGATRASGPDDGSGGTPPLPARTVTADQCLQAIAIKGFAQPGAIAEAVLAAPADVEPILDRLATDGLIASSAGALKLTQAGTARAAEFLAADRTAWGAQAAAAALDAFLELDHEVKDTVTAWQLRDAKAQVLNDHTDPDYDAAVLDRLGTVDAHAQAWFTSAGAGPRRLGDYRERLSMALARARAGDGRFVASPRVDSYHGIWFELHEDLIGLAGRTREAEVEAGRA